MDSIKILHCADIHIGAQESALGIHAESRQAETLLTFEKIIDLARDNAVDVLLISGDLFNSNDIATAIADRVFECFAKIPSIRIIYAAGNHDPLNTESPFKKSRTLPENLYVLEPNDCYVEFTDINTRVYGKSFKEIYVKGTDRFSLETDDNFINLMCIHGDWRSDLNSEYNAITNDFISNSGMDYVALGHVHKRTDVTKVGNTYVSYCGCPEGHGFDELGEKGVYMGEINKGVCKLDFVPTCKRMYLTENIDVSDLTSTTEIADLILDTLQKKYPDNFRDNLYKLILTGSIDDGVTISIPELISRLDSSLYYSKARNKTEFKIDFATLSKENTLKGIFVKNMIAKIDAASDDEKEKLQYALNIGLKAFSGEVEYNEN